MLKWIFFLFALAVYLNALCLPINAQALSLKENLKEARPGDFIVISANKTQTLMHIYGKNNQVLTIEEISVPESKAPKMGWKEWVHANAPGNTSWVMHDVDLLTGRMIRYYSFTKKKLV